MAALIGVSAITGILVLSPRQGDSLADQSAVRISLRDDLLQVLQARGFGWLIQSPPQTICKVLAGVSNSSVIISATFGSYSCSPMPQSGVVSAIISFRLVNAEVSLEAWSTVPG